MALHDFVNKLNVVKIPDKANLELECRMVIDNRKEEFTDYKRLRPHETIVYAKQLIEKYSTQRKEIEQSINFIKQTNESAQIKQIKFINGVQDPNHKHYVKYPIIWPIIVEGSPPYRIMASFESPTSSFDINDSQIIRIKLRHSIYFDKWRIDITLIKNVNSTNNLKVAKDSMLFNIPIDKFTALAPWDIADLIEFETEYIGDIKQLVVGDFLLEEYFKNTTNSVNDTPNNLNNSEYQMKIFEVAKYIKDNPNPFRHKHGMKQLGNQPIELDKNIYIRDLQNQITNYYITNKTDGKRAIILIQNRTIYILTNTIKELSHTQHNDTFIFDAEEYNDTYYIFDVMVFGGTTIVDKPFEQRLTYFDRAAKLQHSFATKPFIRLTDNYKEQITKLKNDEKPYETDGIIFTPYDGLYNTMIVYKYKPIDKLTVDFLIKACPQNLLGIKPYISDHDSLYLLFVGISYHAYNQLKLSVIQHYDTIFPHLNPKHLPQYFPIQFSPSDKKYAYLYSGKSGLDGQVGEFHYHNGNWHLHKLRDDRLVEVQRNTYFGNNYFVAEAIWYNYQDPLNIESMEEKNVYFQVQENPKYKATRSYNRYVISKIFDNYTNTPWVLDMASGKGQDLFRYSKYGFGGALFLDIDKVALMELINRKREFANSHDNKPMQIFTQCMDLNEKYATNIAQIQNSRIEIPNSGFDLVICNFAFHYFLESQGNLNNVINFVNQLLKPRGRLVITAFDGKAIHDLLEANNGEWTVENKYSIKFKKNVGVLMPVGQAIDVMLPFSNGEYYTEYLYNAEHIEKTMAKRQFIQEVNDSFTNYLNDYHASKELDENDKIFVGLYHYYCYYKNGKK